MMKHPYHHLQEKLVSRFWMVNADLLDLLNYLAQQNFFVFTEPNGKGNLFGKHQ